VADENPSAIELAEIDKNHAIAMLESSFALVDARQDQSFQNWYLSQWNGADATRAKIKEQAAIMLRQVDMIQKQLQYLHGQEFRACVEDDIADQKGKKRSVDYLSGRAGMRQGKTSIEVFDEKLAIQWCKDNNCESALDDKLARKTPLAEAFEADGVIPDGCIVHPAEDKFYPALSKPRLTRDQARSLMEK